MANKQELYDDTDQVLRIDGVPSPIESEEHNPLFKKAVENLRSIDYRVETDSQNSGNVDLSAKELHLFDLSSGDFTLLSIINTLNAACGYFVVFGANKFLYDAGIVNSLLIRGQHMPGVTNVCKVTATTDENLNINYLLEWQNESTFNIAADGTYNFESLRTDISGLNLQIAHSGDGGTTKNLFQMVSFLNNSTSFRAFTKSNFSAVLLAHENGESHVRLEKEGLSKASLEINTGSDQSSMTLINESGSQIQAKANDTEATILLKPLADIYPSIKYQYNNNITTVKTLKVEATLDMTASGLANIPMPFNIPTRRIYGLSVVVLNNAKASGYNFASRGGSISYNDSGSPNNIILGWDNPGFFADPNFTSATIYVHITFDETP